MSRTAEAILLSPEERTILSTWIRGRRLSVRQVQRAQIILLAADGTQNQEIARRMKISRPTVQLWRQRFLALRLSGLEKDAPRPGRIPRIPAHKITAVVEATLHTKPPQATHWSTRSMARAQGLSEATVRRIWQQHNPQTALDQDIQTQSRQALYRETTGCCWLVSESSGQIVGLVCRREESNPSPRPYPTGSANEEGSLRYHDTRLQA